MHAGRSSFFVTYTRKYLILCYSCIVIFEGISCNEFTIVPLLLCLCALMIL